MRLDGADNQAASQVRLALGGDRAAEEWLARRAYEAGLRLASFSLGDRELAQDVGQEVAIRVLRSLPKLREAERFDAWVYRICAAEIKRAASRRGRQSWQPYEEAASALREDPLFPQRLGERDWLLRGLAGLSDRQRIVVGLRYVHDLDDREIAAAIGARRGTVRSLLSRALAQLRQQAAQIAETEDAESRAQARPAPKTKLEAV
ncbi:MAG TPA: sigma-70 family RNA polymerase sigma factor [Solirubrobacterales bacterium]|nr:sigma-70 family RNA polymerase sigma factor [Solirubrobacterales bacterium]